METILIENGNPIEVEGILTGLNPFYIMETILMHADTEEQAEAILVLIHSTSWKLF